MGAAHSTSPKDASASCDGIGMRKERVVVRVPGLPVGAAEDEGSTSSLKQQQQARRRKRSKARYSCWMLPHAKVADAPPLDDDFDDEIGDATSRASRIVGDDFAWDTIPSLPHFASCRRLTGASSESDTPDICRGDWDVPTPSRHGGIDAVRLHPARAPPLHNTLRSSTLTSGSHTTSTSNAGTETTGSADAPPASTTRLQLDFTTTFTADAMRGPSDPPPRTPPRCHPSTRGDPAKGKKGKGRGVLPKQRAFDAAAPPPHTNASPKRFEPFTPPLDLLAHLDAAWGGLPSCTAPNAAARVPRVRGIRGGGWEGKEGEGRGEGRGEREGEGWHENARVAMFGAGGPWSDSEAGEAGCGMREEEEGGEEGEGEGEGDVGESSSLSSISIQSTPFESEREPSQISATEANPHNPSSPASSRPSHFQEGREGREGGEGGEGGPNGAHGRSSRRVRGRGGVEGEGGVQLVAFPSSACYVGWSPTQTPARGRGGRERGGRRRRRAELAARTDALLEHLERLQIEVRLAAARRY